MCNRLYPMENKIYLLVVSSHFNLPFFYLQEFISFCETMELVPEEEIETSTQGGANSSVDRRAKKVGWI